MLIEEIYSLNKSLDEPLRNGKEIIENARYRLLRGEDVDTHSNLIKLDMLYWRLKKHSISPVFNTIEIEELEYEDIENHKNPKKWEIKWLYYNPIKNYPVIWNITAKEKLGFLESITKRMIRYKGEKFELTKKFKNLIKKNLIFDAEKMYRELNQTFHIDSVDCVVVGPFYFSLQQDIEPLKEIVEGDVERYLEDNGTLLIIHKERIGRDSYSSEYHKKSIEIYPNSGLEARLHGLRAKKLNLNGKVKE